MQVPMPMTMTMPAGMPTTERGTDLIPGTVTSPAPAPRGSHAPSCDNTVRSSTALADVPQGVLLPVRNDAYAQRLLEKIITRVSHGI
jgi:hypothetical protein